MEVDVAAERPIAPKVRQAAVHESPAPRLYTLPIHPPQLKEQDWPEIDDDLLVIGQMIAVDEHDGDFSAGGSPSDLTHPLIPAQAGISGNPGRDSRREIPGQARDEGLGGRFPDACQDP